MACVASQRFVHEQLHVFIVVITMCCTFSKKRICVFLKKHATAFGLGLPTYLSYSIEVRFLLAFRYLRLISIDSVSSLFLRVGTLPLAVRRPQKDVFECCLWGLLRHKHVFLLNWFCFKCSFDKSIAVDDDDPFIPICV